MCEIWRHLAVMLRILTFYDIICFVFAVQRFVVIYVFGGFQLNVEVESYRTFLGLLGRWF